MPIVTKIKHPNGCLIFVADGEGFEPPDGLPRQRFSRPPHSTALPTILNFFFRRSFNLRFCSLIAPDAAAHHSFALGCALLALLTRTQDRRYCPALPTILNFFFRRSFNLRFCSLIAPDAAAHHSFALGCALLALLTRTQDRRYCPALPTILNFFFRRSFNLRFCSLIAPDAAAHHSFALGCALLALLTRTQDRRYCPALPTIHEPRSVSYSIFFKNANKIHIKNTCLVTIFSFNISASRMGIWFGAVEGPLHSAQICRNP